MSANIPFEMQAEIIKRVLHVKSLLSFRSVSKHWKSLIDSSEFIANHTVNKAHLHHHHLLVRYKLDSDVKFVSIVDDDDDNFPLHKSYPVVPPTVNLVDHVLMFDSSHGLVCLYGYVDSDKMISDRKSMVVIWNPSIRKCFGIKFSALSYGSTIGFGVCPKTSEPKIVRITRLGVDWKVEVFTLSSRAWRSISLNMHLPVATIFENEQVVIDGVIHWVTHDSHERIIRFDLANENFGEVDLPDSLTLTNGILQISKVNKSLVLIHFDNENGEFKLTGDIWMMTKNGFEKLFSVDVQRVQTLDRYQFYGVVGFRKNGQPIREHPCGDYGSLGTSLEAYDPLTKHICDLGIHVDSGFACFNITPYSESLLLLNSHSDYIFQG